MPCISTLSVRMEQARYESLDQTGSHRHESGTEALHSRAEMDWRLPCGICSRRAVAVCSDPDEQAFNFDFRSFRSIRVFLSDVHVAAGNLLFVRSCVLTTVQGRDSRENAAFLHARAGAT